jgi:integrase/recombinase XerD
MSPWSSMPERVEAYLTARRRLGYALRIEGQQLKRFARFAEACGHRGALTLDLALDWAAAAPKAAAIGRARRLETLRPFARFCLPFEPDTQVPPPGILGPAHRRLAPHIYSEEELDRLLAAAGELAPASGLRPDTVRTLLGLLAATGLRVSEALHLDRDDVDLGRALLCVRRSKFGKSRSVPLHPSAVEALAEYAARRDGQVPHPQDEAFFLRDDGRGLSYPQALYAFQRLRTRLGWEREGERRPRLYDLRHTFACRRLLAWYRDGTDVAAAVPLLSTYLGHVKVSDTYWYLTGIPALLGIAGERFERLTQPAGEAEQ